MHGTNKKITVIAVLYKENSLFIVFGADGLGNLRNDFFVLDISHWQWVTNFKANGVYPSAASSPTATNNAPASTSIVNSNSNNQNSSANTNIQAIISFNYMKTIYLMIGVMVLFTFL
jgi:hypothetical protein